MTGKSAAIVGFIGSLMPLYVPENHGAWCARSLQDGSLILPVDETEYDEERGMVLVHWQGDPMRTSQIDGADIAALALDRYVRFHGVGASEEAVASELWFMARHFHFKTRCYANLPELPEPPSALVRAGRHAMKMGQGILVDLLSKTVGA